MKKPEYFDDIITHLKILPPHQLWGDIHITSTLREGDGGGGNKGEMLLEVWDGGLKSVPNVQSFFFLLKKIGFAP